jgi:hypothetical protein
MMANLFDENEAPEGEPLKIVVGDFIQWKKTALAETYPPALYSASYVARIAAGTTAEIQIAAVERSDYYLFTASSQTSAAFTAGFYHWQLEVVQTSSGNRVVVERGEFEIIQDLDNSGADPRTHAEIMLNKIESLLQGRADKDVSSYSIQGRSIAKMSIVDLLQWRDYYRKEVSKERRDNAIALGKKTKTTMKVRFL